VLRRIFGPMSDEVKRGWRKLHNEELHKLYFSPNITIMTKSSRWAKNVARMGRKVMHIRYLWEIQKERDHYKHQDVCG
jgi:hypothetical protein